LYLAVIECVVAVSVETESVACPLLRVEVPSVFAPSRNVTVPVAADGATAAVRVMDCPYVDELGLALRLVVVEIRFTVYDSVGDVLALKLELPP
jgi:hypothetical protein